jgi:diaminohydroxyphosphoribosylaminopyrimidine deaminase / 5-amino-6-(5-phosphoribosylamino)uracil reductase
LCRTNIAQARWRFIMENAAPATLDSWAVAHAAAMAIGSFDADSPARFALSAAGDLRRLAPDDLGAVLQWDPATGWQSALPAGDPWGDLLELYLPISSATAARPITIGHLGQSLDGFIATPSGDAISVTGPENILHLHRLRALCDAVIVGAGTVAADNPRLTTRLVVGSNPVRVILDSACRLPLAHTVFNDRAALTLRVCAAGSPAVAEARARGEDILEVAACDGALDLADLLRQLRALGFSRVFVEGGGVTVSSFLKADLLDRLHIAIAPLLIGEGRPAIRMPPRLRLQDCLRLRHRVYRAGADILFDCDLRAANGPANGHGSESSTPLERIL